MQSRQSSTKSERIKTDDSPKYYFCRKDNGLYEFPEVKAELRAVLGEDEIHSLAKSNPDFSKIDANVRPLEGEIALVFDVTNFFAAEYHSCSDKGTVTLDEKNVRFAVNRAVKLGEVVLHYANIGDNR